MSHISILHVAHVNVLRHTGARASGGRQTVFCNKCVVDEICRTYKAVMLRAHTRFLLHTHTHTHTHAHTHKDGHVMVHKTYSVMDES